MPEFTYENGTKIAFDHFKVNTANYAPVTLPPKTPKGYPVYSRLYLNDKDTAIKQAGARAGVSAADQLIVRVGVLFEDTTHPFPKGIYVPFKFQRWGEAMHFMDGLYGDFIFNEDIKAVPVAK